LRKFTRSGVEELEDSLRSHSALDLYTHLKSLEVHVEEVEEEEQDEEEQGDLKRYPFSHLSRLLDASTPLLLFDPELAARKNALFQAAAHGTGSDVAMLLSLSFTVAEEADNDDDESAQGHIRTYDVNDKDSEGDSPLLLAYRSGNLELSGASRWEMGLTAGNCVGQG
jgi:ankyrin repeat protein